MLKFFHKVWIKLEINLLKMVILFLNLGIFHDMWSKVIFKIKHIQKDEIIQRYYVKFR